MKSLLIMILLGTTFVDAQVADTTVPKRLGQFLPDSLEYKIDKIINLKEQSSPGAVIAIIRNDSVIFEKGYEMANVEYNIKNTARSIYYICSLAKQFTAYSIILLADQKKLKLDDDLMFYLPWTKNFGQKITIRNLLHHTSGIRDDLELLKISGTGRNGIISQDIALNILKEQHDLNFPPGTQYSYSNSNYILLAEVVKVVSKQSFSQFTDSAIFQPLQMHRARFYENPYEIIANRVVSYNQTDAGKYQNSFQNVYTVGDGGLFMSMEDMTHWVMNFFNNKIGNARDIEMLNEKTTLSNGMQVSNTDFNVKGWDTYLYNGGLNGFKTFIAIFPDLKTGFIVFANNGDDNIYNLYNPLADLLILANNNVSKDSKHANIGKMVSDSDQLKMLGGDYIADNNFHLYFNMDKGKLSFAPNQFLLQQSRDTFLFAADNSIKFVFKKGKVNGEATLTLHLPNQIINLTKYDLHKIYSNEELREYKGTYFCAELDCRYQIVLQNHQLILQNLYYNDSPIELLNKNNLKNDLVLGHFTIIRNASKMIKGFEVNNGSLMHLYFQKMAE